MHVDTERSISAGRRTRREFLQHGAVIALTGKYLASNAASPVFAAERRTATRENPATVATPDHLPQKLAICSWQWAWLTHSGPGEAYSDLEEVMQGLKKRNYNAVRLDTALHWCFQRNGSPRGEVSIRQTIPGHSERFRVVNHKGGVSVDALQRLCQVMKLAKQYDIYMILSDWEYMHTTWFVAGMELRQAVTGIAQEERLMVLARHMARLVDLLKDKDLAGQIAYIEPHNEVDYSGFPRGDEGQALHTEAVAHLHERHPDILVSANFGSSGKVGTTENSQLYDRHAYVGGAVYGGLWNKTVFREDFDFENPRKDPLLAKFLEQHIAPYRDFERGMPSAGDEKWRARFWSYHNINVDTFDRWLTERYAKMQGQLKDNARRVYAKHAGEAARLGLPMVVTEGWFFYSPLYSRFEESEAGLDYFDYLTDLAIEHNLWGFLPSTYNGPEIPLWWACPKWLKQNNTRFLRGEKRG